MTHTFFVEGDPQPGGSKTGFYNKALGRVLMVDACKKNPAWKKTVQTYVRRGWKGKPLDGALKVTMRFFLRRPKSHMGTGRNAALVKDSAPAYHLQKPDLTKFVRSTEDACTGILWIDDAQIVEQVNSKEWAQHGQPVGVEIIVEVLS